MEDVVEKPTIFKKEEHEYDFDNSEAPPSIVQSQIDSNSQSMQNIYSCSSNSNISDLNNSQKFTNDDEKNNINLRENPKN